MVAELIKMFYNMVKMATIDSLDRELIRLLEKDAEQTSGALAQFLKVSPSTVRRRIRKLAQMGVLRTTALVDPSMLGFSLTVIIALDVDHRKLESALQMLANRPEIIWVSSTSGRFGILAYGLFRSTNELWDFIQGQLDDIEGLKGTETFICLKVKKGRYVQV